jgi:hypothetical protein
VAGFVSDVADVDQHIPPQLMLQVEAPLVHIAPFHIGVDTGNSEWIPGKQNLPRPADIKVEVGYRGHKRTACQRGYDRKRKEALAVHAYIAKGK